MTSSELIMVWTGIRLVRVVLLRAHTKPHRYEMYWDRVRFETPLTRSGSSKVSVHENMICFFEEIYPVKEHAHSSLFTNQRAIYVHIDCFVVE